MNDTQAGYALQRIVDTLGLNQIEALASNWNGSTFGGDDFTYHNKATHFETTYTALDFLTWLLGDEPWDNSTVIQSQEWTSLVNRAREAASNPRFVLCVGPVNETFPDIPEDICMQGYTVIWDRQEKKRFATINENYSQVICLELRGEAGPSGLTNWVNSIDNEALTSEGISATDDVYLYVPEGEILGILTRADIHNEKASWKIAHGPASIAVEHTSKEPDECYAFTFTGDNHKRAFTRWAMANCR